MLTLFCQIKAGHLPPPLSNSPVSFYIKLQIRIFIFFNFLRVLDLMH